ncbi:MAG: WYL domain-containing protein [Bacteroidetes bacterium]|nr:WYL domain-containing protein [Bacteroidota bacterium]MCH8523205.1 WYL domain-containing protein [Balneolales bacterium]
MNSAERRMKLLLMLQSKTKALTVNYLADYFQVSRRTIFRDLKILQEMEVPLTYEEHTGYGIMRGYTIPPLMFNPKEIATIMMGLNFAKSQKDTQLVEDAKAVELKISSVVPAEMRNLMNILGENVIVDPYADKKMAQSSSGDWFVIANAIAQNQLVEFVYSNKKRLFQPMLLVYFSDHWNVIGLDELNVELRNFRIEKMVSLSIHPGTQKSTNKEYSKEELIYRNSDKGHKIDLDVREDAWMEFRIQCPAIILSHNKLNDIYEVVIKFDNLDYLNHWLLRFTDKVSIKSPGELLAKRKLLLKTMLDS